MSLDFAKYPLDLEYYVLTDSYILFDNHYSNLTNYNYKSYFGVMDDVFNLQGFYEKEKTE